MSSVVVDTLFAVGLVLLGGVLLVASLYSIRYHILPPQLVITWMGLPVRRVPFEDIRVIATRPHWRSEPWCNTLSVRNRRLVLRLRQQRWCDHLTISPKSPFVFRAELYQAMRAALPALAHAPATPPDSTELIIRKEPASGESPVPFPADQDRAA